MRSGPNQRSLRRKNRKLAPPLSARIPRPSHLGRWSLRALRTAAPALIAFSLATGVGAGSYFGYHWLTQSERFAVTTVEVSGNQRLTQDRVNEILGLDGKRNIFGLGLRELQTTLEADGWIAEAEISRRLPNTLVVEIRERTAAALIELGGLYLADAEGHVFKRAALPQGEGEGLPIITGISRKAYLDTPDATETQIREALDAHARYQAKASRPRVSEVHLCPRRGIVFHTLASAMAIRMGNGDAELLAQRLDTFDAAWASLTDDERASARVVYLDNETRPDRVTVGFDRKRARRTDG